MTYEDYVGFELNAPRMALRRVYYEALAKSLAESSSEVPYEVVAAVCNDKATTKRLVFEIESAREAAKKGF